MSQLKAVSLVPRPRICETHANFSQKNVMRLGFAFAGLLGLWLLLSGYYTPFIIFLGVLSCVFSLWLGCRLQVFQHKSHVFRMLLAMPGYLPWFSWEIIKSNIDVCRLIWRPKMQITPQVLWVPANQKTDLGIAAFANSITLTPGTLTLDSKPGQLEVHALTPEIAAGLLKSDMDRRICKLEGTA